MKKNVSEIYQGNIYKDEMIFIDRISEGNQIIKYILNFIILLGASGFLIVGISSYFKTNIVGFLKSEDILFFPQGITMCLYGTAGIIVSLNQFRILLLQIGEGYNKFDKEKGVMEIFRKGFKGKESDINITYPITDIVR